MSLESQSRWSNSTLCRFLDQHLPQRGDIAEQWRKDLRPVDHPVEGDRAQLGTALEMRIGLDVATDLAYPRLLGFLPAEHCARLLRATGLDTDNAPHLPASLTTEPMAQSWSRISHPLTVDGTERDALLAVLTAVSMDQVAHRLGDQWSVQARRGLLAVLESHRDGHGHRDEPPLLEPLAHLWENYLHGARPTILGLGKRVLIAPELAVGFATADLVIGLTVVEIKNYADPARHVDAWLNQLLGYALADRWNTLYLKQIALYCGWQAATFIADLDEVLRVASSGPTPVLGQLRDQFHQAMRDDLDEAAMWHARRRTPAPSEAFLPT